MRAHAGRGSVCIFEQPLRLLRCPREAGNLFAGGIRRSLELGERLGRERRGRLRPASVSRSWSSLPPMRSSWSIQSWRGKTTYHGSPPRASPLSGPPPSRDNSFIPDAASTFWRAARV
jgi:hypothetical protein